MPSRRSSEAAKKILQLDFKHDLMDTENRTNPLTINGGEGGLAT